MQGVINKYISDQSKGFTFDWRPKAHLYFYKDEECVYCKNVFGFCFIECSSCNVAFPHCELMFGYYKLYLCDKTCNFDCKCWYTDDRPDYVFCKECYPVFVDSVKNE